MKKKVLLIFIIVLLLMNSFVVVRAEEPQGALGSVLNTMEDVFGFVFQYLNMEKVIGQEHTTIFLLRTILWILLFSILYYGSTKVFKDATKGVKIIAPGVLATLVAAGIPTTWLIEIFKSYWFIGSILIRLIPIAGLLYVNQKLLDGSHHWHYMIRALLWLMLLWVFWEVGKSFKTVILGEVSAMMAPATAAQWFDLLMIIPLFGFFSNFFKAFGGVMGKGLGGEREGLISRMGDRLFSKGKAGEKATKDLITEEGEEVSLSKKERAVLSDLVKLEKAEIHDVENEITNLKAIRDAISEHGKDDKKRRMIIKRIEDIRHEENELSILYTQTIKRIRSVGSSLKQQEFVLTQAEKDDISSSLGIRGDLLTKENRLKKDAKNRLNQEFTILIKKVGVELGDIISSEKKFTANFKAMLELLRLGSEHLKSALDYLDRAIVNKEYQKDRFKKLLGATKTMDHLDKGELSDAVKELKMLNI